ncbi:hypothetical protein GlitD10_0432 [Gloeomargarita lithophora Alchichica-D10]|uniref:Uncharacterized protein n=1 Tax=Gloeomargarita lithophora Alchichica-D10 TaxID=1188229 RepID=A0A1J0A9Y9_9CYAN|nr:hypothetical protein [Gloeomargarita lithophora]APB32743.1 hypothetical protein GlitD10_0432 [Gloeomargarita lithophora Alchichica-D10]
MVAGDTGVYIYEFTLPLGYGDDRGQRHQIGGMRPLTGGDEYWLDTQREWGQGGGMVARLARGLVRLGTLAAISPVHLEQFWLVDFVYIQHIYQKINPPEVHFLGEWRATPWRSCTGR